MGKTKIKMSVKSEIATVNINISFDEMYLQGAVKAREGSVTNPEIYTKYKILLDELNLVRTWINQKLDETQ